MMKENLNSKLNDAITKFCKKESLRILKERMTNVIFEDKTESTEILEFPSIETGREGTNLKLVLGEKRNDEKENEDKKGNGEQHNDNDGLEPEVDYFLDGNEFDNEGTKNDGEINRKENDEKNKAKLKQKRMMERLMKMRMMKRKKIRRL
ncbi:unnamed protein product [Lactuca saligna]|uniref:Uncharacterized protein n=1 Tax=Lactuca saligna TaxID=75948 RepID=A0AA36E8U3_LACSI|nr:unnamed protein product [Lactuca saligna]